MNDAFDVTPDDLPPSRRRQVSGVRRAVPGRGVDGRSRVVGTRRIRNPNEYPDWLLRCGHYANSYGYITYLGAFHKMPGKYLVCPVCNTLVRVKKEEDRRIWK